MDAIDRPVSSTPAELKGLIRIMDDTRMALGDGRKICQPAEKANVVPSRRGLYAARRLAAGTVIGPGDVAVLRPATSLPPSEMDRLIGSVASRDIGAGEPFAAHDLALERAS